MEKISSFRILKLTLSGFKCFGEPQSFSFGDLTMITGSNHVGKSTIADAIAFAVTGTTFFGEGKIDRLYSEQNPEIEVKLALEDQDGAIHELIRARKKDRMSISFDGYNVRQLDLNELFGERDVFLSVFNPLYFIEELGEDGKALLEKHLPFVDEKAVTAGLSEFGRSLLHGKDIPAPETYMKNLRDEIRELKECIIVYEGQSALLMTQRRDSAQALNLLKVRLDSLAEEIASLEAKKAEGGGSALQAELDAATDVYNELLGDKPAPPQTEEMERELREAELALERVRAKVYESKFTQAIAETNAALSAAYSEHGKIRAVAARIKPGGKCPVCFTEITEQTVAAVNQELAPQLAEIVTRGKGLKSQLTDLQALDGKAKETFEQFRQEDIQKSNACITELRENLKKAKAGYAAELTDYEAMLTAARSRMQAAQDALEFGGLTPEESTQLSGLLEQRRQAQADFDAQEAVYRQQTDDTADKIAEVEKQIKQKETLLHAVADYAAKRAELTFEKLSAGEVRFKLFEVFKTTGEVKDCFKFTYRGRDYKRLSRSERILAGVHTSELVKRLTGRNYPVFIDDSESVSQIPMPTGQAILSRVVANAPLSVKVMGEPAKQAQAGKAA